MPPAPRQIDAKIAELDALLVDREDDGTSSTIFTLRKELDRAIALMRGGFSFGDCEDFVRRRLSWRVKYDLLPSANPALAQRLLEAVIFLGMRPCM